MIFKKKDKKAMIAMETLVKYIIAIASLVVLVAFIAAFLRSSSTESIEQTCRTSVIARDKVKIGTVVERIVPLNCVTEDITLPTTTLKNLDQTEKNLELQKEIADLIAQCWWMFGNGQITKIFTRSQDGKSYSGACHHCYTFYIPPGYDLTDGKDPTKENNITNQEFFEYLLTHNYQPGLLKSGGATLGTSETYNFEPQKVRSTQKRPLTRERLLSGRKTMNSYLADFTDIYTYHTTKIHGVDTRSSLNVINEHWLQVVFVVVPELIGEDFKEYNNLPLEVLNEWQIGSPELDNGMIFIFSLNDGIILYGSQTGANAVLAKGTIETLLQESKFFEIMKKDPSLNQYETENSAKAIAEFADLFIQFVEGKGVNAIKDSLDFQQSYYSYITGGAVGFNMDVKRSDKITVNSQGQFYSTDIEPNIRYAVIYHSSDLEKNHIFESWNNNVGNKISIKPLSQSICRY